jgi:hypothetical protein
MEVSGILHSLASLPRDKYPTIPVRSRMREEAKNNPRRRELR